MKKLKTILPKKSGRAGGTVSVRHQGGRQKRYLREVDFKRDKKDVWARVEAIEYDPNRNADLALLVYEDGDRRYILSPAGLKLGDKIIAGEAAPFEPGNALPLAKIPVGSAVHNIEIKPGKGGQLVKSAGAAGQTQGSEGDYYLVKLPSGQVRRFDPGCWATIGQVGKAGERTKKLGRAGRKRKMGIRPSVRGTAQNPHSHPHGGGEGRSGVGLVYPKTPWGKPAVGKTRKKRKYSDKLIVADRKRGPHARIK